MENNLKKNLSPKGCLAQKKISMVFASLGQTYKIKILVYNETRKKKTENCLPLLEESENKT